MATVVYNENSDASGVGELIGAILGYRNMQKQKAQDEENRKSIAEMMHRINTAKTREEALAVSEDPKYQRLFGEEADHSGSGSGKSDSYLQDQIAFGKMIKEIRPDLFQEDKMDDYTEQTLYHKNGEERRVFMPKKALLPGAPEMQFGDGWSLTKPTPKEKNVKKIDLFDESGRLVRSVDPGEETSDENSNLMTKSEFDNNMKLSSAEQAKKRDARLAEAAKRKEDREIEARKNASTPEWEAAARGMLTTAGVKPEDQTPERINIAVSYAKSIGTKDRQFRTGLDISEATPMPMLAGTAAGARLDIANSIYGKITNEVLSGRSSLSAQDAISIAIKGAKALYDKDSVTGNLIARNPGTIPVYPDSNSIIRGFQSKDGKTKLSPVQPGMLFRTPKGGNAIFMLIDTSGNSVMVN